MKSLLHNIQETQNTESWRCFRISQINLDRLLSTLRGLSCTLFESPIASDPLQLAIRIEGHEVILLLIEQSQFSPSPFRLLKNPCTLAFTKDRQAIRDLYEKLPAIEQKDLSVGSAVVPPAECTAWDLLENAENHARLELQCRTYQALLMEDALEQEGEELFQLFGRKVRSLLCPDYVEIQVETPSDFWTGRLNGWVWRDSSFTGQMLSILLSPRAIPMIYRREKAFFIEDSAIAKEIMNPSLVNLMNMKSGFLLPLVYQGSRIGVIKLFYNEKLHPIADDYEALEQFRAGVSALFYHSRLHLRAQHMATIDGLTDLFNHRFFRDQLRKEFQRARRYRKKMSLIMIDIDDFKVFNDTHGHLAGDRALFEVASTIRKAVRDIDFVARYGGEEFALILPEINAKNGLVVAEKIRKAVEMQSYGPEEKRAAGAITISCGVTDNTEAKGPDELIERADRALYWVKKHGRNLVRVETVGLEEQSCP